MAAAVRFDAQGGLNINPTQDTAAQDTAAATSALLSQLDQNEEQGFPSWAAALIARVDATETRLTLVESENKKLRKDVIYLRQQLNGKMQMARLGFLTSMPQGLLSACFHAWSFAADVLRTERRHTKEDAAEALTEEEASAAMDAAIAEKHGEPENFRLAVRAGQGAVNRLEQIAFTSKMQARRRHSTFESRAAKAAAEDSDEDDETGRAGTAPWVSQVEDSIDSLDKRLDSIDKRLANGAGAGGGGGGAGAGGSGSPGGKDGVFGVGEEDALLGGTAAEAIASLQRESKAAEGAIAQALKLLQAQVMSKASRSELQHGMSRAMDAAFDAQERSRAVAASLVSVATDVDTRASGKDLYRLESFVQQVIQQGGGLGGGGGGGQGAPMLRMTRLNGGGDNRDSPLQPTHCLACNQALTYPLPAEKPHETQYRPTSSHGRSSTSPPRDAGGRRSPPAVSSSRPRTPDDGSPRIVGQQFWPTGGTDARAKMHYGKEPANELRKQTQRQLASMAGAPSAANSRLGSARKDRPIEALLGRPTSAPALPRGAAEHTAGNKKVFGVNNGGGAPSPALVPGKRVTVGMGNHSKWLRSVGA